VTSTNTASLVLETLDTLQTVARNHTTPTAARDRLRALAGTLPETRVDLVWQEQTFDHSREYQALIRQPGLGTLQLSHYPDHALPWSLRGVQPASDQVLLRVGETHMRVDQAMACIDFIWDEADILRRLIDVCLLQAEVDKNPIELSDAELQAAVDAFRRTHRLYTANATHAWLQQRGLTLAQVEEKVRDQAVILRVKQRLTDHLIGDYFEQHRAEFDRVRVLALHLSTETAATQLHSRIVEGELSFEDAVADLLARADTCELDIGLRSMGWSRRAAPSEAVEQLFEAQPGAIIGPLALDDRWSVLKVLAHTPARLDDATRCCIADLLMRDWLDREREGAVVEWLWGNDRPAPVA
jgi:putative peptide maturation system protein